MPLVFLAGKAMAQEPAKPGAEPAKSSATKA